jgi:hypothetical protein
MLMLHLIGMLMVGSTLGEKRAHPSPDLRQGGSGKTTLARELGRTLPAIVFVEDEWIATLGFEIRSLEDFRLASQRSAPWSGKD